MKIYLLVSLLFGSLSWGQATSLRSALSSERPAVPTAAGAETPADGLRHESGASTIALDKPLITIRGLCGGLSADTATSDCKTVMTRAQFEEVINALEPNMPRHARREFALHYAEALVMARKAVEIGLDKGADYEEQMKLARIQVLSQDLKRVLQAKASQISDEDIEDYYRNNITRFEKAEIERIYVPKTQQTSSASDNNLSDAEKRERMQKSEQTMKEEADNLRAHAVGGEEFAKLQADAYKVAGIKSGAPNTSLVVRRSSLPPNHVSVMDLNPGEVSSVLADSNGYVIYWVKKKETLPLDQSREEIKATLRSQRMQDEMRGIQNSATPTLDESYFAR
jgi:hypothetical protein